MDEQPTTIRKQQIGSFCECVTPRPFFLYVFGDGLLLQQGYTHTPQISHVAEDELEHLTFLPPSLPGLVNAAGETWWQKSVNCGLQIWSMGSGLRVSANSQKPHV